MQPAISISKFLHNKYIITVNLIIISVLLVFSYHYFLFNPSQETIRSQIVKEFVSKMETKAVIMDNTLSQYVQGANSMSSRSMIRNKIEDFYTNKITLNQLKDYTFPKYKDGVQALDNFVYARRVIRKGLLVETGNKRIYLLNPVKVDSCCSKPVLNYFTQETLAIVYVISPIIKKGFLLGNDIIYYDIRDVVNKINDSDIQFKILHSHDIKNRDKHENYVSFENGIVTYFIKSEYSDFYFKFSTSEKNMFSAYQLFFKEQIVTITLLVLLILFIIITIYRREKFLYIQKTLDQEKKYRWMMENSHEAIVIRQDGRFIFANNALAKMLGYSVDSLLHNEDISVFSEKARNMVRETVEDNEKNNNLSYQYEIELIDKNGQLIAAQISENIVDFNDRKAYFSVIRDITQQKEFLELMRKNKDQSNVLGDFISICASCQSIKDNAKAGNPWIKPADYITERLPGIQFSHGICPDCAEKLYPGLNHPET